MPERHPTVEQHALAVGETQTKAVVVAEIHQHVDVLHHDYFGIFRI
jgi:hypothetical protein